MDWDAKMPPWDLSDSCLGTVVGQGGGARRGAAGGLDCSVDLKLGGGGGELVPAAAASWKVSKPAAAAPAPAKRPRAQGNGGGGPVPACLVEGCTADLSKCREYHRRHKVCEAHSKTPVVTVAGQQQRFCQQCSRFHLLVEFDEVKRSCRKRLDGHNRRRRKPQPESLNSGGLFTSHHGTRFASYPHIFSTSMPEPKWPGIVKTENDAFHGAYPPLHLNGSSLFHAKERKHFPFLGDSDTSMFNCRSTSLDVATTCQPLAITPSESSNSSSSRSKMFVHGGLDSCALSLLSDPTSTPAAHLGQMITTSDQIPLAQPLGMELRYGGLGRMSGSPAAAPDEVSLTGLSYTRMEDKNLGSILAAHQAHQSTQLQYQGLYQINADQGSSDGAVQALPFSW